MKTTNTTVNGIQVIEYTLEESDFASIDVQQTRMSICNSCQYQVNNESCSKCSCLLANRVKYIEMFCPEGKW